MSINRGDIFYVNPSETVGSEQRSGRPAIIVSNPLCNEHSPVVEVVYLTCQYKKPMPTHVRIESAGKRSTAPAGPDVDDDALALIALRFLEGFLQKRCGVTVQDRLSIDLLGQKND